MSLRYCTAASLIASVCITATIARVQSSTQTATQPPSGVRASSAMTVADSASAARAEYRMAVLYHRRGALDSALIAAHRASAWWPSQPAYAETAALIAARASDTTRLLGQLRRLTAFEAGTGVVGDSAVLRMGRDARVREALARLQHALRPVAASARYGTLRDSSIFPEGMDVDPRNGTVYVAGIRHGTVTERRRDGSERVFVVGDSSAHVAALAVRVDTVRGVLWVTTSGIPQRDGFTAADSAFASLLRMRIADGVIEARYDVPPAPGGHVLGDLAITSSGDVLFTDSQHPVIYRLRKHAAAFDTLSHALFRSLQGIAPVPGTSAAYVADYSHGLLLVDFATSRVQRVSEAADVTAVGLDGIALYHDRIIGVQNGFAPARIVELQLSPAGTHITRARTLDRNARIADEPTIGALYRDHYVYVANSQWEKYDEQGALRAGARLSAAVLLALPLTPPHANARGTPRARSAVRQPETSR